uniref:G-protein coupled receptors family 1 profile domain-containing protein n=1 Tax=Neogobius melanostomus TaxID=47308 RepID=A0A8C6TWB4_9GOBI
VGMMKICFKLNKPLQCLIKVYMLHGHPPSLNNHNRIPLFVATLLCYCLIWVANVTIIVTIIMDRNLHEPMYIFICNLCINALFVTAGFYPKFLIDLLSSAHVISKAGCLFQGYVIHGFLGADYSILLLMAFDRYVAICRPLVYHSIMTRQRVSVLSFLAWFIPLKLIAIGSITTSNERLCGSHIPKIYCINYLVNRIACAPSIAAVAVPAFNYTFFVCQLLAIVWSYVHIIKTCTHSKENRVKFMKTCLPHIICLIIFFGSLFSIGQCEEFMAIEFLIVPPLSNPLIYGLKLTKIRNRLLQTFGLNLK